VTPPLVVISVDQLEAIVENAVAKALAKARGEREAPEWVARKSVPLPRKTLQRLEREGHVATCMLGREKFIKLADVDRYFEERSRAHVEAPVSSVNSTEPEPGDAWERAVARADARKNARVRIRRAS